MTAPARPATPPAQGPRGPAPGTRLGPLSLRLTRDEQTARLDALEVTHPLLRGAVFLPVFLQDLYYALADPRWDAPPTRFEPSAGPSLAAMPVAAAMEVETRRPCSPATGFTGELTFVDRYERRGGHYAVSRLDVTDEAGVVVAALGNTTLLNPGEVYRARAGDAGRPPTRGGAVGLPEELGRRHPTLDAFQRYCRLQGPNHHTDPAAAARLGLPGPLAPGPMLVGYLYEALLWRHGEGWLHGSRLRVTFTGPVWAGDGLRLLAGPGAGAPASVPLAIDTAEGRRVLVGEAWP